MVASGTARVEERHRESRHHDWAGRPILLGREGDRTRAEVAQSCAPAA
jgi:hypothetical protein